MQHHAADHLDIEMAHAEDTLSRFTDDGKGLGQQLVQRLAPGNSLLNSPVFACSASSVRADICGSRALMPLTVCEYCLISRSLRLPKIFLEEAGNHYGCGRGRQFTKGRILACRRQGPAPGRPRAESGSGSGKRITCARQLGELLALLQETRRILGDALETNLEMQVRPGRTAIAGKPQILPTLDDGPSRTEIFESVTGRECRPVDLDQIAVLRVPFRRDDDLRQQPRPAS